MERILISVRDKAKAQLLLELLRSLDFVESVDEQSTEETVSQDSLPKSVDFFRLAGLWEGREINLSSIRQRAWPRQSS